MSHLTDEEIGRFLSGGLSGESYLRVARHLLSQCRSCQARLGSYAPVLLPEQFPRPASPPADDGSYGEAVDRVLARARETAPRWEEERRQIGEAVERLRKGMGALEEMDDIATWPLVEALIQVSQEARFRNPEEMLEPAFLAEFASRQLDPELYSPGQIADLRIRALAEYANAYRVNDELESAEEKFAEAARLDDRVFGRICG